MCVNEMPSDVSAGVRGGCGAISKPKLVTMRNASRIQIRRPGSGRVAVSGCCGHIGHIFALGWH